MFHLQKCAQGRDSIFWQTKFEGNKVYLVIDYKQTRNNIYLSIEKPANSPDHSNMTHIIRKYANSVKLISVFKDKTQNTWLVLEAQGQRHHLLVENASPPMLHFMNSAGETYCRMSKDKVLTKAIIFAGGPPDHQNFDNLIDEVDFAENPSSPHADTKNRLKRKLKTLKKSLAELTKDQPDEDHLPTKAAILAKYLHLVPKGVKEFIEEGMKIELDPKLSPGQNLSALYNKIKKMELKAKHIDEQIGKLTPAIEDLTKAIEGLAGLGVDEVNNILKKFKIPLKKHVAQAKSDTDKAQFKARKFQISDSWLVLVGKSAADNDLLTKQAKSNDYWMHVTSSPGSHTVIKPLKKAPLEEIQIRAAGILTIHFSKLSKQKSGEVCFTQKRYLKKPKGFPPGKWLVEKAKNIMIRYTDEELANILAKEDMG